MGMNSKAKRDAKAKAKAKQQRAGQQGFGRSSFSAMGDPFGDPFGGGFAPATGVPGALFRRSCSECGSEELDWMSAGELAQRVREEQKPRVQEGIDFLGAASEAWLCGKCGNFGLMS
ncbi:hypothetical protein [Kineococcus auxinigenes]|uniref:hypothetical protein n=1 Tax=unclassified Kineococcus TaxID=2621656 RepID=UPI003D7E5757